jgi:methyl-accepting chemotaxis protein
MTGMRLGLSKRLDDAGAVELAVCLPQDDLDQYEAQNPLQLRGRVAWQRLEGGKNQCGIVFEGMSEEANRKLRECFEYYNKTPEFN